MIDEPAMPVLSVDRVTFGYRSDRPVVHEVSVGVMPGQLCAVIGPNAAGKSTLFRIMLGHLRPWSGSVTVGGRGGSVGEAGGGGGSGEVSGLSASGLARLVSYVPQRSATGFAFSVQEVVQLGRYAVGPDPDAVDEAIRACDLGRVRHQVYAALSVGQQQRVLLARAMAQSAAGGLVMLLDEPVNAMDLWHVHRTMKTLVSLARAGLAVVVVVHDINLAARYADTAWVLDDGRIVSHGSWDTVVVPEVLEAVYRVRVRAIDSGQGGRPFFVTEPRE